MIGLGIGLGFNNSARASDDVALRKIALIDGQFLRAFCDNWSQKLSFDFFENLNWSSVSSNAVRTFYYDSLPAKRSNQTDDEFQEEYQEKIEELDFIRSQKWYHVKDGVSRYRKKDKKREQKGVDILLAIDAVQMAAQGLADEITIFTSDTDFFPVFEMMNQTKCRGILRYELGKTSDDLLFAADQAAPISLAELASWCGVGIGNTNSIFPKQSLIEEKDIVRWGLSSQPGSEDERLVLRYDAGKKEYHLFRFMNTAWNIYSSENFDLIFAIANQANATLFSLKGMKDLKETLI